MPIHFDKYDTNKIELLKNHLSIMAEKGKPLFYEIVVDALKAVPKTDDPKDFDSYEHYISSDTTQVKIIIYDSGSTPRNNTYLYVLRANSKEEAMDMGVSGLPGHTKNSLSAMRESYNQKTAEAIELETLRKENKELKRQVAEMNEYSDQLAAAVETAKENGNKIGGVHWGEVFSVALEGLVRRNTHILAQIPAVSSLAGLIDKDNKKTDTTPQVETEATFKKKEQSSPELTEMEKEFISIFHELQKHFTQEEIGQVMEILDSLSKDKTQIVPTMELLKENN